MDRESEGLLDKFNELENEIVDYKKQLNDAYDKKDRSRFDRLWAQLEKKVIEQMEIVKKLQDKSDW